MLRALRSEVETAIEETLADLGFPTDDLGIERPPADVDAVLATSVAYRLAGEAGAPPPEVAADIADALGEHDLTYAGGVEAEGAYVNVLPGERYYADTLAAAQEEGYGRLPDRGTDLVLEHTSANPTGPVHVGRARNPVIGD
ncbi:MAG: arginyl-tRNA synthetase, partial [Salinirussus sp.]